MGKWVVVPAMHLKPYCCIACGGTPRDDATGDNLPAYFCEAVDLNWADSLFLCQTCVRILSELYGAVSPEKVSDLQNQLEEARTELEETLIERDESRMRIDRMLDGKRAVTEAKKARTTKKVKASA